MRYGRGPDWSRRTSAAVVNPDVACSDFMRFKGALVGTFAAQYGRLADGNANARGQHLHGEGAWVIGEQRARNANTISAICRLRRHLNI